MVALFVVLTFIVFIVISSLLQRKEAVDSVEDLAGSFSSPNHSRLDG